MNPYLLLAVAAAWLGSTAGAFVYGQRVQADHQEAVEAREERVTVLAATAAADTAASAIANIRVVNTTVQAKVQHEIETHTVYRDCVHSADGLRNVNAALANQPAEPAGGGVVPDAGAASGPVLRSNDR